MIKRLSLKAPKKAAANNVYTVIFAMRSTTHIRSRSAQLNKK